MLRALIDARLLTSYEVKTDDETPTRRVEIIHESLLANWPRLVRWQTQDADAVQVREQLRQAARTWDEHGRSDDLLWTGSVYREYSLWRERYPGGLTELEEAFARAMTAHARRRTRRRRLAIAAALLVAAAAAAVFAGLWRRSEQQTLRAEGAHLRAAAGLELDEDPTVALAWATASLELADTPEARRLAVEALWRGPTRFEVEPGEGQPRPDTIDLSPDGRFLAANTNSSDELLVWSEDGGAPRIFGETTKTRFLGNVRFSTTNEGEPVLLQQVGSALKLWSVPGFEVSGELRFGTNLALLAAGKFVAFWERDGGYLVRSRPLDGGEPISHDRWQPEGRMHPCWEPEGEWFTVDSTGEWLLFTRGRELVRRPLEHLDSDQYDEVVARHPADIARIACGRGGVAGDLIPTLDADGVVRVWSPDPDPLHPVATLRGPGTGFDTDPSGTLLFASTETGSGLQLWDTAAPPDAEPLVIPPPRRGGGMREMEFRIHPERRWLVGEGGGTLYFWPLDGPYPRVLKEEPSQITGLTFVGDGDRLASASRRSIRLWPLSAASGELGRELVIGTLNRNGVAANPAGDTLLIARWYYTGVHRMELATGRLEMVWSPYDGIVWGGLGFSPDGRQAAAAATYAFDSPNMVMRVWDTATWNERVFDLRDAEWSGAYDGEYLGGVGDLQFTPDGGLLTSGSGGVRLWDLATGEAEWVVRTVDDRWMILSADRSGRTLLTAETVATPDKHEAVSLTLHDRSTGASHTITSHGERVSAAVLDPTGTIIVTSAPGEGVLRVGRADGSEPHPLYGHQSNVIAIAISPDSRWIASGDDGGEIRIWPMPDVSTPPLHTLPHDELMAKLETLTNLRVVRDEESAEGWKVEAAPFAGWKEVPKWW